MIRVQYLAHLLSDTDIFSESDLTQRHNVNVVFLELLRYYGILLSGLFKLGLSSIVLIFNIARLYIS